MGFRIDVDGRGAGLRCRGKLIAIRPRNVRDYQAIAGSFGLHLILTWQIDWAGVSGMRD